MPNDKTLTGIGFNKISQPAKIQLMEKHCRFSKNWTKYL
jgi:hypothetical protein